MRESQIMICESCELEQNKLTKFRSIQVCSACETSLTAEENQFRGRDLTTDDERYEDDY